MALIHGLLKKEILITIPTRWAIDWVFIKLKLSLNWGKPEVKRFGLHLLQGSILEIFGLQNCIISKASGTSILLPTMAMILTIACMYWKIHLTIPQKALGSLKA